MNQLCKVCGEPAAGFHFGAFTCEGCKSFFGRTYNNLGSISECKNNGECVINKKNRTACKACRLRKCLLVGMSKSGSRYGRRSNWFKIHCLLQEQQQQQANFSLGATFPGANVLRPHPYLPFFRAPQLTDTKSSESDSGASSADPEDDMRSNSALSFLNSSPLSDKDSFKKLPSPSSDSECISRRKLSASITLTVPGSPASLPSISPGAAPRWLPPLHGIVDPTSWRDLWIKGPKVADVEPLSQEQPIDLSIKTSQSSTQSVPSDSEPELSIDVGVEEPIKPVPLDLTLDTKRVVPEVSVQLKG